MMDEGAVRAIGEYAQDSLEAGQHIVDVGGVTYSTKPMSEVRPREPQPETLKVGTLAAVVDYLQANRDEIDLGRVVIHVSDPVTVEVVSELMGHNLRRHEFLQATARPPAFAFGRWFPREEFNIALQSLLLPVGDRDRVLVLIKQISDESSATETDDGVTQRVAVKKGLHLVENANVPNPVTLAPFRTFSEVEQPTSPFILRIRKGDGIEAALFEADGGAWRLEAIRRTAEWLGERVPSEVVILA